MPYFNNIDAQWLKLFTKEWISHAKEKYIDREALKCHLAKAAKIYAELAGVKPHSNSRANYPKLRVSLATQGEREIGFMVKE